MTRSILVTGGAGYIGSHTVVQLVEQGHDVVILDSFVNSDPEAVARVQRLTGKSVPVERIDMTDAAAVLDCFRRRDVHAVVHFAGLKAVGESVSQPLRYFENNVTGTLNILAAMTDTGCTRMVFSSSATVYGDPERVPIPETATLRVTNPYGRTKLIIEDMLRDLSASDPRWKIALLRYFNPVGAHESGLIGEDPQGLPNNLMPFVAQVAVGRLPRLQVFGGDYPTPDGTGVRDYIHVVDLAAGHLAALEHLDEVDGCEAFNLGTGRGTSVLEMVAAFEAASGRPVPYEIVGRRAGDIATCYADPGLAQRRLGWRAELDLRRMCEDAWRWQSRNPQGFRTPS